MLRPIVKWAGGKRQLLPCIRPLLPPADWTRAAYFEPFIGGAALLLALTPDNGAINDVNQELINVYQMIKQQPDRLIEELRKHRNDEDYYYEIRAWDRNSEAYTSMSPIKRAARLIYLNRTCYNGLYRVNAGGQFNVPFGKYKRPNIIRETTIRSMSAYLNRANIRMMDGDFADAVQEARAGDFVYFDPPYDTLTPTAAFTSYAKGGFGRPEQQRLANVFKELSERGVYVMLSNHATDYIQELYKGYRIHTVKARRSINSKGDGRGVINEVIIMNY
ncbi:DNA adenine methylase [Paenibacillus sp.]|uniref:DNA adenine methylase n=1 Tax=Paenibacillus sp. TaxID=58172 RepID=UPI003463C624